MQVLKTSFNNSETVLFSQPEKFYEMARYGQDIPMTSLMYRDIVNPEDRLLLATSFLKPLVSTSDFTSVKSAIDDLKSGTKKGSKYASKLDKLFSGIVTNRTLENHVLRANNELVKRRFRLYQILETHSSDVKKAVLGVMKAEKLISLVKFGSL